MPENNEETAQSTLKIGKGKPGPGRPRKTVKLPVTLEQLRKEPLESRLETLRYQSADIASRIADEIRKLLELGDKRSIQELKSLAIPFAVFLDKAAQGTDGAAQAIKLPAQALAALKIGIAIQVSNTPQTPNAPPTVDVKVIQEDSVPSS